MKWSLFWRAHRASVVPLALVIVGCLVSAGAIGVSVVRPLTPLEQTVFQLFAMALGLGGAFAFGRAKGPAPASVKSAFRRLLALYGGLGRLRNSVAIRRERLEEARQGTSVEIVRVEDAFDLIDELLVEQLNTATGALSDWEDLAPNEVAEVRRRVLRGEPGALDEMG